MPVNNKHWWHWKFYIFRELKFCRNNNQLNLQYFHKMKLKLIRATQTHLTHSILNRDPRTASFDRSDLVRDLNFFLFLVQDFFNFVNPGPVWFKDWAEPLGPVPMDFGPWIPDSDYRLNVRTAWINFLILQHFSVVLQLVPIWKWPCWKMASSMAPSSGLVYFALRRSYHLLSLDLHLHQNNKYIHEPIS